MLINYKPKFKIVEINNVAALRMGHMIDQIPAYVDGDHDALITATTFGDEKFVENGLIVGLDRSNALANYKASKHSQPCLVYTDELTGSNHLELDEFAHKVPGFGKPVYVRALPLSLGDTFTTNNVMGMGEAMPFARVTAGRLELQAVANEDTMFIAKMSELPAGQKAIEFTYIGLAAKSSGTTPESPESPVDILVGTTWYFNESCDIRQCPNPNMNFISNSQEYDNIYSEIGELVYGNSILDEPIFDSVYNNDSGWKNEAYRTIQIINGKDVTDKNVINWLTNNATLVEE